MENPQNRVPVEALRRALLAELDHSSLRALDVQVGIGKEGLRRFADGSRTPSHRSLERLRNWYELRHDPTAN